MTNEVFHTLYGSRFGLSKGAPGSATLVLDGTSLSITPYQYGPGLMSFGVSAGYYPGMTGISSYGTGTPSTSATAFFTYFAVPNDATISALAIYLNTGQTGAKARLGAYSNVAGMPSALLADFGEVDLSGSSGIVEAASTTLAVQCKNGGVWLCVWMKNVATQATVTGAGGTSISFWPLTPTIIGNLSSPRGYSVASAYPASLPSTAPGSLAFAVAGSNGTPLPFVKIQ